MLQFFERMNEKTDWERVTAVAAGLESGDRFLDAIRRVDATNAEDPNRQESEGSSIGYELYFSRLLFAQTLELRPDASEALLIASRSQHIARWKMPRTDYPEGRAGYLKWRADLKVFHADETASILEAVGYERSTIDAVRAINLKKDLKKNADSQSIEDALCLVFLKDQFAAFRHKTSEEKMVRILQKTWAKMSPAAHEAALALDLGAEEARLVGLALEG